MSNTANPRPSVPADNPKVRRLLRSLHNIVSALDYVRHNLRHAARDDVSFRVLEKLEREIKEELLPSWIPSPQDVAGQFLQPAPGIVFEFGVHTYDEARNVSDDAYINADVSNVESREEYEHIESMLADAANNIAHTLNELEDRIEYEEGSWAASDEVDWYDGDDEEVESTDGVFQPGKVETIQIKIVRV